MLETSNRYDRPYRPLPIACFNRLGGVLGRAGVLADLEEEALIAAARRKSGLHDFGDEWFREPLRVLIDSINREARLTPLGKIIQRGRIVSALVSRLRAEALCRAHPEILEQELGAVIVIAGLQRTGTTLLHRLLAADPDIRTLITWEALDPLPPPGERPGRPKARQARGLWAVRGVAYLAPEFFAIHPGEFDAPEEDVLLLDLSFMSQAPEAILRVPSYAAWLEEQDHTRAYEYLRKLMQLLLWQRPAKSWVLKSPHHMEYLDTVLEVFPEARIVQTHRDPRKIMGSFCSMVAHGRGVFSDDVDPKEVAAHWVRKVRRLMERSIAVRQSLGEERFLDVSYYDLLKDPIAEVERIHRFAGIEFSDAAIRAAEAARVKNVQHKYGRHRYRLEDFGLSEEGIDRELGFYRERYGIPYEQHERRDETMQNRPAEPRGAGHMNPVTATLTGIRDLFSKQPEIPGLADDERIDGKLCLITGANSGLGKAAATQLAERGAQVIMACRSGIPEAGLDVVRASGNDRVEMMHVDLADLQSVHALCNQLRERGLVLDIIILNAGLVLRRARKTAQGFEMMFGVNFLANRLLLERCIEDGVVRSAEPGARAERPRIIFVSSEAHRSSDPIDFERFGAFVDYGLRDGMAQYASSKLHICTYAAELSRRLNPGAEVAIAVHAMCPGAVNTNLARESPIWLRPLLAFVMRVFFRSPEAAAEPLVYLACSRGLEGRTGAYLHMMREKSVSAEALDPEKGRLLWEKSAELLRPYGR